MRREHAWRIFAGEFNDAQFEEKGIGEMSPSYIITPLGAKINRVFIVGVLTDVEPVSEDGGFIRAHVSDPTGVFTIYSGKYQPEITEQLSTIEVPAFVAIMGKTRAYIPEEGDILYASIRPQQLSVVTPDIRDQWIVETSKLTHERINAIREALQMTENHEEELLKLGYSKILSSSIANTIQQYEHIDIDRYLSMIKDAIQYVTEGPTTIHQPDTDTLDIAQAEEESNASDDVKKSNKEVKEETKKDNENEETVLEVIKSIEGEDGASWDLITEKCEKLGLDVDTIEEAMNDLMEKGLIYEPVLGTIKTT